MSVEDALRVVASIDADDHQEENEFAKKIRGLIKGKNLKPDEILDVIR